MSGTKKKEPSLGGLEPPTFRLTAERANRLRHRDKTTIDGLDGKRDFSMQHTEENKIKMFSLVY